MEESCNYRTYPATSCANTGTLPARLVCRRLPVPDGLVFVPGLAAGAAAAFAAFLAAIVLQLLARLAFEQGSGRKGSESVGGTGTRGRVLSALETLLLLLLVLLVSAYMFVLILGRPYDTLRG